MNTFYFDFKIPRQREELLTTQSCNQFSVSDVLLVEELELKINDCQTSLKESGCDFILEHFGTLFSVLQRFKNLDFKILQLCYDKVIVEGLEKVNDTLYMIFEDGDIHPEIRIKMLNVMKMSIYIAVEFLKSIQEKVDQTYSLVINKKGQKNTKLMKLKEDHNWDWEENEKRILFTICKIVKQPLNKLWDPPTPEEEFVRMIEDCCYSILEMPSITSVKLKPTRDVIFEILAILIAQYNNTISCKVKIVQMLKLYEHLVSVLAQAVLYFVQKHNYRSLIKEIIVEIIETGSEMDTYSHDQSSHRAFSSFLVEITTQEPELVLPCVNFLTPNLNCDPYSMRICALTVMAEIVTNVLHSEAEDTLTEENRNLRDAFLEHLLDHILDINVFVRCRVLKLWQNIIMKNAVPKYFVALLLDLTIQRLNDKSSNVVKNAIKLISVMLKHNPYAALLDENAVKQNLHALKSKLISKECNTGSPSMFKMWFCIRSEFSEFIENKLKEPARTSQFDDESENDTESEDVSENNENDLKTELFEFTRKIQASVTKNDFQSLFSDLKSFEIKYLKSSKLLKKVSDRVEYYQWILGHMCRENENTFSLSLISKCKNATELKTLINQPVVIEEELRAEFGSDYAVIIYCEDYVKFVEMMSIASTIISDLMMSKNTAESLEAIEFFKCAHAFGLSGAETGLRNMLLLITSKEPGIREAVLNTYKEIYLGANNPDSKGPVANSVEKLMILLKKVTFEQKNALNDLIKQWAIDQDIGADFALALWDKYCRKSADTSTEHSHLASVLIRMYASGKPAIIRGNLEALIRYALNKENHKNYALVKYTSQMLQILESTKNDNGTLVKYSMNSDLIQSFINVVEDQFTDLNNIFYSATALEVIRLIYQLSELPDRACAKLIVSLIRKTKNYSKIENEERVVNEELLIRMTLIIGQVAFSQWQYLENDVHNELKRRSIATKTVEKKRQSKKGSKNKTNDVTSENVQYSTECTIADHFEDDAAAMADEQITDAIRMVCEDELFSDGHLFSLLSELTINICEKPEKYAGNRLQSAASISLCRMMMVSSEFCEKHIQLFITILERTKIPEVKINLILAFGDLTFRFPNTIEPWTIYFYNRLRDKSKDVRYTAVLVVSHLVTNEMIKVRGQMSDFALCLVDEDVTIRKQAFRLFHELSQKGNSLYNVMPDIISRLSHPDYRTSEENFQIILKILMKLITKDRHLESIVEKLCHRFGGAADERQCIDLSYCLTLIPYTERALQKLVDNIVCYAEKLNYARVHKNFTNVIIACKKLAKLGKLADVVQELENKIEVILTRGIDNLDCTFLKPPKTPARFTKTPRPSKCVAGSIRMSRRVSNKTPKRLRMTSDSEDSDADE